MLKSGKSRIVVRRSLSNVRVQIISFYEGGDKTEVDFCSKSLKKYGWKGHGGSVPSAYLAGYKAGSEAIKKGIEEAIADIGMHTSIKGSVIYAAIKGAKDAGMKIPLGADIIPDDEKIRGAHIAEYAKKIKGSEKYSKQFSFYLKNNFSPEDIPKHFDEVKKKIDSQ